MRWNNILLILLGFNQIKSAYHLSDIQNFNQVRIIKCDAPTERGRKNVNNKFSYLQSDTGLIIWKKGKKDASLVSIIEGLKDIIFYIKDNEDHLRAFSFNQENSNLDNIGQSCPFNHIFYEKETTSYNKATPSEYDVSSFSNAKDVPDEENDYSKINSIPYKAEVLLESKGSFLVEVEDGCINNAKYVEDEESHNSKIDNVLSEVLVIDTIDGVTTNIPEAKNIAEDSIDDLVETKQESSKYSKDLNVSLVDDYSNVVLPSSAALEAEERVLTDETDTAALNEFVCDNNNRICDMFNCADQSYFKNDVLTGFEDSNAVAIEYVAVENSIVEMAVPHIANVNADKAEVDGSELKEQKAKAVKEEDKSKTSASLNISQNELHARAKGDDVKKFNNRDKNKIVALFVFGVILLLLIAIFIYYCFAKLDESDYDIV